MRDCIHLGLRFLRKLHGTQTSGGFYTANACGHSAFAGDFEQANVASALHVGTATQFARCSDIKHAHRVAVFLTKQHHGTGAFRTFNVHDAGLRFCIGQNFFVHNALNLSDLLGRHGAVVCKVKAGFFSVYQRTFLAHMVAQHFTQGLVHQVGCTVVANGAVALVLVNLRANRITHFQFTRHQLAMVAKHIGLDFLCIQYAEQIQAGCTT